MAATADLHSRIGYTLPARRVATQALDLQNGALASAFHSSPLGQSHFKSCTRGVARKYDPTLIGQRAEYIANLDAFSKLASPDFSNFRPVPERAKSTGCIFNCPLVVWESMRAQY